MRKNKKKKFIAPVASLLSLLLKFMSIVALRGQYNSAKQTTVASLGAP
jgi:hypothetical protein